MSAEGQRAACEQSAPLSEAACPATAMTAILLRSIQEACQQQIIVRQQVATWQQAGVLPDVPGCGQAVFLDLQACKWPPSACKNATTTGLAT